MGFRSLGLEPHRQLIPPAFVRSWPSQPCDSAFNELHAIPAFARVWLRENRSFAIIENHGVLKGILCGQIVLLVPDSRLQSVEALGSGFRFPRLGFKV